MYATLTANLAPCPSRYAGGLTCDLKAGHDGKHGEVASHDDEGRVDGAVTWTDAQADGNAQHTSTATTDLF